MAFDYPLPEPPFPIRPFQEMKRGEAERHFEWFVAQAPIRLEILRRAVAATGGPVGRLDGSPESLIGLWEWATPYLGTKGGQVPPSCASGHGPYFPGDDLDTPTKCLVVDVGYYLADVLMRQDASIQWTLWDDPDGPLYQPVLSGFDIPLVPKDIVTSCAWGTIRGDDDACCLKKTYDIWWNEARLRFVDGSGTAAE